MGMSKFNTAPPETYCTKFVLQTHAYFNTLISLEYHWLFLMNGIQLLEYMFVFESYNEEIPEDVNSFRKAHFAQWSAHLFWYKVGGSV